MICVQIYGARTIADALALAEMGVDHLGIEVHEGREQEIAELIEAVRGKTTISLLPLYDDLQKFTEVTRQLRPEIVHFCESDLAPSGEHINAFRAQVSPTLIMQAIPVGPEAISDRFESLALAKAYDPYVDFLLLDTTLGADVDPVPGFVGVTGKTHDWRISRAIVEQCNSPVILAGGLDAENVAESIRVVRPWGVDSCTGTNLRRGVKDLAKSRAFIEQAREAARSLE